MSMITQIANAVKTELNDTDFSIPFTAEIALLPVFELKDMRELKVTVVPKAQSFTRLSRGESGREVQIDIGIQKKFSGESEADELLGLVEEIAARFDSKRLTDFENAICAKIQNDPVYAPEHIEQYRQFTSVLTLTFKVVL